LILFFGRRARLDAYAATVNLDLLTLCAPAYDFNRSRHSFVGYVFAYYFDKVVGFAQEQKKSLDRVLTELILTGMTAHPVKTKALFWFSATNELLLVVLEWKLLLSARSSFFHYTTTK
jgi:hypothetical protein